MDLRDHLRPCRLITFPHVRCYLSEDFVLSVFRDGTHCLLDVTRSHGPAYGRIAALFGYDDPARDQTRYARHHDLTHHWLADRRSEPSPVLLAVAHGGDHPDSHREELHVNSLQRLWADRHAGRTWREEEAGAAQDALGSTWQRALISHHALLDGIA